MRWYVRLRSSSSGAVLSRCPFEEVTGRGVMSPLCSEKYVRHPHHSSLQLSTPSPLTRTHGVQQRLAFRGRCEPRSGFSSCCIVPSHPHRVPRFPPGPAGWPLAGNLDVAQEKSWVMFKEWGKTYGLLRHLRSAYVSSCFAVASGLIGITVRGSSSWAQDTHTQHDGTCRRASQQTIGDSL